MPLIPADQDLSRQAPSGLMALVQTWLADLPRPPETPATRRAALRREIDALAWTLVGRLEGVEAEIPLDRDTPNR
jgi:hypothetical protein